jgi:hypothetical protein
MILSPCILQKPRNTKCTHFRECQGQLFTQEHTCMRRFAALALMCGMTRALPTWSRIPMTDSRNGCICIGTRTGPSCTGYRSGAPLAPKCPPCCPIAGAGVNALGNPSIRTGSVLGLFDECCTLALSERGEGPGPWL